MSLSRREMEFAAEYAESGSAQGASKAVGWAPRTGGYAVHREEVQEEIARIRGEMQARIQRDIPGVYAGLMDMAKNAENAKIRYLCSKEIMQVAGYHSEAPKNVTVNIQINGYLPPGVECSLRAAMGREETGDIIDM